MLHKSPHIPNFSFMAYKACILILAVFLFDSIVPVTALAQRETKRWYKGNLHTHTYWSDGDEYPELVLDWYKSHDYYFVALSAHNTLARDEKWVKVIKSGFYEASFKKYVERFGKEWVTSNIDS